MKKTAIWVALGLAALGAGGAWAQGKYKDAPALAEQVVLDEDEFDEDEGGVQDLVGIKD